MKNLHRLHIFWSRAQLLREALNNILGQGRPQKEPELQQLEHFRMSFELISYLNWVNFLQLNINQEFQCLLKIILSAKVDYFIPLELKKKPILHSSKI